MYRLMSEHGCADQSRRGAAVGDQIRDCQRIAAIRALVASGAVLADGDVVRVGGCAATASQTPDRKSSHERLILVHQEPDSAVLLFIMLTLAGLMAFKTMKIAFVCNFFF